MTPLNEAQRASVGSTEASASLLARVGVVGPKRARFGVVGLIRTWGISRRSRTGTTTVTWPNGCAAAVRSVPALLPPASSVPARHSFPEVATSIAANAQPGHWASLRQRGHGVISRLHPFFQRLC